MSGLTRGRPVSRSSPNAAEPVAHAPADPGSQTAKRPREIVHLDIGKLFITNGGFGFLDRKHDIEAVALKLIVCGEFGAVMEIVTVALLAGLNDAIAAHKRVRGRSGCQEEDGNCRTKTRSVTKHGDSLHQWRCLPVQFVPLARPPRRATCFS